MLTCAGRAVGQGMGSCWGDEEYVTAWTTCMARTFLQPQLHKAVGLADALGSNHCHLKVRALAHMSTHTNTHAHAHTL